MAATFNLSGIPMCCGVTLQARAPKTHCTSCYQIFDYQELRNAMCKHRLDAMSLSKEHQGLSKEKAPT